MEKKSFYFCSLLVVLNIFWLYMILKSKKVQTEEPIYINDNISHYIGLTRDFFRYECKNIKRIGGRAEFVNNAPDALWRIDGAWFTCFDQRVAPSKYECNVLSYGINHDYTFDEAMNRNYGCLVHSFDPFIEDNFFKGLRNENTLSDVTLKVNSKWFFHRIGVKSEKNLDNFQNLKISSMIGLMDTLRYTNLINTQIDIFKIDIEGAELHVFEELDIDYACMYFKQILMETHLPHVEKIWKALRRLEKCFLLFLRNTRFYKEREIKNRKGNTGHMTEFQGQYDFTFKTSFFRDEIFTVNYLFSIGELHFVNKNFL
jgi:hypothetical protein